MTQEDIRSISLEILNARENNQSLSIAKEKFIKESLEFWEKDKANRNLFYQINQKITEYHTELSLYTGKQRANITEQNLQVFYSGSKPIDVSYVSNMSQIWPMENDTYSLNKAVLRGGEYWRLLYQSPNRDSHPFLTTTQSSTPIHFDHSEPFYPRWLNGWFLKQISYEYDPGNDRWNWKYFWERDAVNPSIQSINSYLTSKAPIKNKFLSVKNLIQNGVTNSSPTYFTNPFLSYSIYGLTVSISSNNSSLGGKTWFVFTIHSSSNLHIAKISLDSSSSSGPPYLYTGTIQGEILYGSVPSPISDIVITNHFPPLTEEQREIDYNGPIISNGVNFINAKKSLTNYLDSILLSYQNVLSSYIATLNSLSSMYDGRDLSSIPGGISTKTDINNLIDYYQNTYISLINSNTRYSDSNLNLVENRLNLLEGLPSIAETFINNQLGVVHCLTDNINHPSNVFVGLYGTRFKILAQRVNKYFGSLTILAKHVENKNLIDSNQTNNNNIQSTYSEYMYISLIRGIRTVQRDIIYIENDKKSQFIGHSNIYALSDDLVNNQKLFINVGTVSSITPEQTQSFAVGIETSDTSALGVKNIEKLFVKVKLSVPIPSGYRSGTDGKLRLVRLLPPALPVT